MHDSLIITLWYLQGSLAAFVVSILIFTGGPKG